MKNLFKLENNLFSRNLIEILEIMVTIEQLDQFIYRTF